MTSIVQEKTPEQSAVETTHVVLPPDTNSHGTAFGGKIMQWMDIAAGIAAGRHAQGPVVTVSVDDLHFARPIKMGNIVCVRTQVNYTGRTSMEIGVRVIFGDSHIRKKIIILMSICLYLELILHLLV